MVISGEPSWPNAKVFSLAKMIASSDDDYFVISDSDILVGPDFLRNVIPPLLNAKVGLVTCLYQGIPAPDFWSQMEAIGMSVEMPAGVMVADMVEGMKFALGAAMTLRRDAIEAIGGIRETADFYSDDFVLGNLVAEAGYEVVLSHYKVGHVLSACSLRRTFGDQLRWMKSTRYSRPWGHVGSGLTYAVPFGLLALLLGLRASRASRDRRPGAVRSGVAEPHAAGADRRLGHHSRSALSVDVLALSAARPAGLLHLGGQLYREHISVARRALPVRRGRPHHTGGALD